VKKTLVSLSVLALASGLSLAACGSDDTGSNDTKAGSQHTTAAATSAAKTSQIMVDDAWVKATDSDMTAMFGTVMNHSGKDRTIVSAKADVAGMVQLHETVADGSGATTMKEKKGGFPLSAGKSVTLQPGGDHVMLMGLKKKLQAGDTVTVTLTLDDGSAVKVQAPVKPFSGAKETYAPTDSAATHG
jgi:copper(I)-binding protein